MRRRTSAGSIEMLIAFRVVQAIPGGLLPAVCLTMVYRLVPPAKIGAAMGMYGLGIIVAPAIGPALGGYLVEYVNWRLVFYINLPVGVLGLVGGAALGVVFIPQVVTEWEPGTGRTLAVVVGTLALAVVGGHQVVADPQREGEHAADLDVVLVGQKAANSERTRFSSRSSPINTKRVRRASPAGQPGRRAGGCSVPRTPWIASGRFSSSRSQTMALRRRMRSPSCQRRRSRKPSRSDSEIGASCTSDRDEMPPWRCAPAWPP